jgi:peptidoglycan/LPS O-acetylase OafA/YrhL
MIPANIAPLTGVRFVAAFAVVLYHFRNKMADAGASWAVPAFEDGYLAVPFFFTLSGFILSHVYFPSYKFAGHGRFMWLRFARLWPVHLAMTGAMVLLAGAWLFLKGQNPHTDQPFSMLLPDLLMVRSWYDGAMLWNVPAWSIQIEWFAYLVLFPICALTLRRISDASVLGVLAALVLAIDPFTASLPGKLTTIICPFIIGSIAYRLRQVLPETKNGGLITILGLVACAAALPNGAGPGLYLGFAIVIFGLSHQQGIIANALSSRALIYGGEISYSLYMSHYVVSKGAYVVWEKLGVRNDVWPVIVTMVATLGVAALVYHAIEKPANKWLRVRQPIGSGESIRGATAPAS